MALVIRDTTADDIATITTIYGDHVNHGLASFEYEPPSEAEMTNRFQTLSNGGHPYLVGELNGEIIGYAYAGAFHTRKAYERTVENSVYLAPKAQGQGIGTQLLDRLILECRRRKYRQMIAVITKLDPAWSVRLHEKAGFEHVGTLKEVGFKKDQWLDVIYMQLAL
ncbi:MAG: N-acetyltransferase family protein [Hyphomicrobiales bacterium]